MKRVPQGLMVVLALVVLAAQGRAAATNAVLSGVVRDSHGTPQMGAMVELLNAGSATIASAITDDKGRYRMGSVMPGQYGLRATAAFFVPATRNLSLQAGTQAVINLTMNTLFEAGNWLPAERRPSSEPDDDWKWTLRCTANRPLLRLIDPESGLQMSTSATEVHKAESQGRVTVMNGDGAFGDGGMHQVLTMDRAQEDGDAMIFRADLGDPQSPLTATPSVDAFAGYERTLPFNGRTRMVASYASHPELIANGQPGFEVMRLESTQEIALGDMVLIDAGTLLEAERLEATLLQSEPYARVVVKPGQDTAVEFRWSTGRVLQSSDDLNDLKPQARVLSAMNGHPLSEKGDHEEISVTRKLGDEDSVAVRLYTDEFANGALMGSGAIDQATVQSAPLVSDPTTLTFRLATAGYTAHGASAVYTHTFVPGLQATAVYEIGKALRPDELGQQLTAFAAHTHTASAASVTLHGKIAKTGTAVNAEYRWQPVSSVSQVDAYNTAPDEAYLSIALRQHIYGGKFLGHGNMDAVLEATNLLEQGYTPVLAPDGHTLFLAQVPRAIQAGVSFNF